jgi:hypothetical protein
VSNTQSPSGKDLARFRGSTFAGFYMPLSMQAGVPAARFDWHFRRLVGNAVPELEWVFQKGWFVPEGVLKSRQCSVQESSVDVTRVEGTPAFLCLEPEE